jgi:uncharacterized protein YaiI (UPF0178 family)
MRENGQLYIHTSLHKHFLLKTCQQESKAGKQDSDLHSKAQQDYQDRFIEAIAREIADKKKILNM